MRGLEEIQADNERACECELAELQADTVKGLRHALATGGVDAVTTLLKESATLDPILDRIFGADGRG